MSRKVECSKISELVQSGLYQDAISAYSLITNPLPTDDHSLGRAYWGLGDFLNSEIYLNKSLQRGVYAAIVDLIQLSLIQNKTIEIENRIRQVDVKKLKPKEKLQLDFIQGELFFRTNKLHQADLLLTKTWIQARSSNNIGSLAQSIGQTLASVLHLSGQDSKALKVIDGSLLDANEIWTVYLKATKCKIHIFLGEFEHPRRLLNDIGDSALRNPQLKIVELTTRSLLKFLTHEPDLAIEILQRAIKEFINKSESKPLVCRAFYYLIGMLIHMNQPLLARSYFLQFELCTQVLSEKALLLHRKGQYHIALGEFETAIGYLEQARATFHELEWRRELGWTLLQLAYAHAKLGNSEKASVVLDSLSDIVSITESAAFLELEKRFIGDLSPLTAVASSYGMLAFQALGTPMQPISTRPAPDLITFHSFGNSTLSLNGQPISCKLHRSFAVMAYLLLYPHSSLENIITHVFEDSKDVEAARNYFHTARFELSRALPCVKFAFDKFTKTYAVDAGTIPIEFDYLQTMQLLHAPTENDFYLALEIYRGPFMRGFEGQWIEEVRENMEWLLVRSGLKLVQEMYETGDYQACRRLTERLLKVEPLDESLNELLVRATREVEGALASRKAMSKVESQFLHEVGELPPTLAQLKSEMKFRMN